MNDISESYRRFLEGDDSGLTEIIRECRDGLILYINLYVGNVHTAEELAEDTFVKLFIKKPRDKGGSSFRTWLYTIGRNTALDYLRKKSGKSSVPPEELPELTADEEQLEAAYIKEERRRAVLGAMKRLNPEYGRVLWLVYFEDLDMKSAAKILGRTVHATQTLVYRARLALREELEKEGFEYENL